MRPSFTLNTRRIAPQPNASEQETPRAKALRTAVAERLGLTNPAATNADIFAALDVTIDANRTPPARPGASSAIVRTVRAQQGDDDEPSYETLYPASPPAPGAPSARAALSESDALYAAVFGGVSA